MDRSSKKSERYTFWTNPYGKGRLASKEAVYSKFKCSSGWLDCFKGVKIVGESGTVSSAMTQEWTSTSLPALLSECKPEDIYNANETGLFYKCLPGKNICNERRHL